MWLSNHLTCYQSETFCEMPILRELTVGRCGENVRFIIQNGLLNIYGNGEMNNYYQSQFLQYKDEISSIFNWRMNNINRKDFVETLTVSIELSKGTLWEQINYILETDGTMTVYGNGKTNNYAAAVLLMKIQR